MSEIKYPVIVRINGQQSFECLTLAQANARFIVAGNRLVVNNVEPLTLEYCSFLLEQVLKSLSDCREEFEDLCSDIEQYQNNQRLVLEYLQPKLDKTKETIKKYEFELDFLTKAVDFLNN